MKIKESDLIKECISAASHCGATVFRNNIGALQNSRGEWVRYGVGGVGGSDLLGYTKEGRFIAMEIKTPQWVPYGDAKEKHAKQLLFIEKVNKAGGIGGVVRGYEDVKRLLNV